MNHLAVVPLLIGKAVGAKGIVGVVVYKVLVADAAAELGPGGSAGCQCSLLWLLGMGLLVHGWLVLGLGW